MRLFLSDLFFDKFTELPKNIQQRVRDFQKKFRDNSQSAAIHLESIAQFKDSSLRSARVDGEYRAILGSLGQDNYMLLWVDKHDDAYKWAKNKKFAWNEHTQSCQIIPLQLEESQEVAETKVKDDNSQPSLLDSISDDQLLKIGVPSELVSLVRGIKDLDDLDVNEKNLPQDVYENLFAIFDGEDINDIIEEIEEGKVKDGEDALLSNNNKRRFIEITSDEELAKIMSDDTEKWMVFLHQTQRKLVNSDFNGTVKVSGSAGTGKTIAALHRLKYLCSCIGANVLFTTYTKALFQNIKTEYIPKMNIPADSFKIDNIDQVLSSVAKEYKVLPLGYNVLDYTGDNKSIQLWKDVLDSEVSEFTEDFLYTEYIDVIIYNNLKEVKDYLLISRTGRSKSITRKQRLEIWKLKEKYEELKQQKKVVDRLELFNMTANYLISNDIHPYTNVIADEFQDFSNPELRFLRALVKEGRNDLFLTGDPYQRIYSGRKINFSAAGINVRGKRSVKLKVNYRTTEEIKRIAVAVVKEQKYEDLDGGEENNKGYVSLIHGNIPTYKLLTDIDAEAEEVKKYVQACIDENIQLNDICIAARSKRLYRTAKDEFKKIGIKTCEIENGEKNGDKDGVLFCTFHSLKGLERKVVILVGVNENTMPSKSTSNLPFSTMDAAEIKDYLSSIRSLLYVAITRARFMVFITGYGEPTGLIKF